MASEAVKIAVCGCCGIWEECTLDYIGWVEEKYGGVWVCGLCEEAIKDEQARLGVEVGVALRLHAMFRETISSNKDDPPSGCVAHSLIQLIKKIISSSSTSPSPSPSSVNASLS
ncbi:Protein of unknown function DUF1677, plant [Dillenia turbinata]|uniref:Uncharacterized protein n=1 Tax=Dillenia turbinata TaxID=194707 RepID=A0AAN8V4P5_9MAGN